MDTCNMTVVFIQNSYPNSYGLLMDGTPEPKKPISAHFIAETNNPIE